jgi:hypothetical protein
MFSFCLVTSADNQTNSTQDSSSKTKIQKAYDCLEEKADDCSKLSTQEIALTIMATPDNVFDDCVDELKSRKTSDHWNGILETSLAIIALAHAGEDTQKSEEWLLKQNQTPTDLIWYLQQDSNSAVKCNIGYASTDYPIMINEEKKIDKNAGSCLTRAQSNFWLQISNTCYSERFKIECDQDFIANLIYRNKNSPTIYVLEGTASASAFGSIDLLVKSKCFGDSGCNYEATAWATLALLGTGHNVEEFIPYIVAMSESNQKYLPSAFIYTLTKYEDYASSLIGEQKLGNYWEAKSSAYNKFYDTGLALLSLSNSNTEQITKAKDWLLFSQGASGCWQNEVRETAIILWALENRKGRTKTPQGTSTTYCSEANFFCLSEGECVLGKDVRDNYFCPGVGYYCCTDENIKSCSEYGGQTCPSNKRCSGNVKKATDTDYCCTGSCEEKATENECEDNYYGTCMDSCSEYQEPLTAYSCNLGQTCCKTKTTSTQEKSTWWIWVLIVLILITLGAIGYVYREQLKLYWFQFKTKFKKDDGKNSRPSSSGFPGVPPRPGFPPIRRTRPIMPPQQRQPVQTPSPTTSQPSQSRSYDRRDKAMSETFEKLRDMSK